jgi:hypothetical protein
MSICIYRPPSRCFWRRPICVPIPRQMACIFPVLTLCLIAMSTTVIQRGSLQRFVRRLWADLPRNAPAETIRCRNAHTLYLHSQIAGGPSTRCSASSRAVDTARPLRVMGRSRQPQRRALLSTLCCFHQICRPWPVHYRRFRMHVRRAHSEPHRCASDVDRLAPALAAVERFASPRNATSSSSCSARRSASIYSIVLVSGSGSSEHVLSFLGAVLPCERMHA